MKLSELKIGEKAVVSAIGCEKKLKTKLSHLGLIEGAIVKVERFSPLGDPVEIEVRGFYLALRKDTTAKIEVKKI